MLLVNSRTGIQIGSMDLPGRKKRCLVVSNGYVITKYATFNDNMAADKFMEILAEFVGAEREEE